MTPAARFRPAQRLHQKREFEQVFAAGSRSRSAPFLAVCKPNSGSARLGLAISKHHAPTAVERNRVKRQIREDFRKRASALSALDCVVCLTASPRTANNKALREALQGLWARVGRKCGNSSSS